MEPLIIDRGRGPEIKGTRITVYTIMDYLKMGWHRDLIAAELRLSSQQVQAAVNYINNNQSEIATKYQRILRRAESAKNPPEVEAVRLKGKAKLQILLDQNRKQQNGDNTGTVTRQ